VVEVHLLWIVIYHVYMAMDLIFHREGTDGQGLPVVSAWAWIKNNVITVSSERLLGNSKRLFTVTFLFK
jgi:hypothetical protein